MGLVCVSKGDFVCACVVYIMYGGYMHGIKIYIIPYSVNKLKSRIYLI